MTKAEDGLKVQLDQSRLPLGQLTELRFRILGQDGSAVTDFDVEHERPMHLIVVRKDLTGFQHLHPEMADDGTWTTQIELPEAGEYRMFADFSHAGQSLTLTADLTAGEESKYRDLPPEASDFTTDSGYEVRLGADPASAGRTVKLVFNVSRAGEAVQVEPYLGADGHLVALRAEDLAFLHVHPMGGGDGHGNHVDNGEHAAEMTASPGGIRFMSEFPSAGRYRLFLQFKHGGEVHTAEFTREVAQQ